MPKCADGGQERKRTVTWTKSDQGETVRRTKLSAEGLATSALGPSLEGGIQFVWSQARHQLCFLPDNARKGL
jgi:hypothetical protein